jgi:long-chain acyl-CoA synthetase
MIKSQIADQSSPLQSLGAHLIAACQQAGDRVAIRERIGVEWRDLTYTELLEQTLRITAWLRQKSIKPGDKVAIILDNGSLWISVYFAILLCGATAVPLDPQSSLADLTIYCRDAGVVMVVNEIRLLEGLRNGLPSSIRFVTSGLPQASMQNDSLSAALDHPPFDKGELPVVDADMTASMIYTSGTTCDPKGVELTHANLLANCQSIRKLGVVNANDVFLAILPLFHAYAFMATLLVPLLSGAQIIYPKTLKSTELLGAIRETKVTIMVGVPELFVNIHRSIVSKIQAKPYALRMLLYGLTIIGERIRRWTGNSGFLKFVYRPVHENLGYQLRYLITGGARLDPMVGRDFFRFGFILIEGYGLTETAPIATLNPPDRPKIGSVGRPVPDVQVKIVNPNPYATPPGSGEVAIQGPNVMKGYYRKPAQTQAVLKDGWFYSGDLGYFDQDGYLFLSGRQKEVIVLSSGKNIFPEEIERHYLQSGFIKEMAVFITEDAGDHGLKAVIVPDIEAFKKRGEVNWEEKIRWDVENISKSLSSYKRIYGFAITLSELPKTRLGKIRRFLIPEIYAQAVTKEKPKTTTTPAQNTVAFSGFAQEVISLLQKELQRKDPIRLEDHLELDLGIDSLARVELMVAAEQRYRIKISEAQGAHISTVAEWITFLEAKLASQEDVPRELAQSRFSWRDILFASVDPQLLAAVNLHPSRLTRGLSRILKFFLHLNFRLMANLKVNGLQNLPAHGPYLICCNHASYLDAFVILAALPPRVALQTYFLGTRDIFLHPTVRWSNRFTRLIPVDASLELVKAMQLSQYVLTHGQILCIFPEGQRSIDGEVKSFKKGIGILAKELNLPVITMAITGAFEAWPRTQKYPRPHPIHLTIGPAVYPKDLVSDAQADAHIIYQTIADKLRETVIALWRG